MDDPNFLSLVPALVAIGMAFLTKQVLVSLFFGRRFSRARPVVPDR